MPAGAPTKYKTEYNEQVYRLALLGATDKEMADFFNIVESTFNLWKNHKEFSESIKRGKIDADANIAKSLYKRAKGYQYDEITYEDGEETKRVTKEVSPDTGAAMAWLKNRRPKDWRDKQEVEAINTNTNYNYDMSKLSKEQLDHIISLTDSKEIEKYFNECINAR